MRKKLLQVMVAAAVLVGATERAVDASTVPGEEVGAPAPPVEALVAVALERSPSVAAVEHVLAAAREMVAPAGALPDPMVELMLQNAGFPDWTVGSMEMSMIGPELRQSLPYPGKREARREVARAEVVVRAGELEQLRRRLAAEIRSLYARVFALDRERAELRSARELLDLLVETAAARYGVGETEQEAMVKAMLEVSRLAERVDDLDAERAATVANLNRLLDQPGSAALGEVRSLPPVEAPPLPWEGAVLEASAEVAVARSAVAAAEKRVEVARLDLRPDFSTGAGVGLRGDLDPVLTLRFGVEWPLWRRNKQEPLVRAAEHELEAARAEQRAAEAAARSEAAQLAAAWLRAERQILRYREALLPQTSAAVDAARASYLAGRGDFSTVVEDFRMWLEARTGLARLQADRFAVWARLLSLLGEPGAGTGPETNAGSEE